MSASVLPSTHRHCCAPSAPSTSHPHAQSNMADANVYDVLRGRHRIKCAGQTSNRAAQTPLSRVCAAGTCCVRRSRMLEPWHNVWMNGCAGRVPMPQPTNCPRARVACGQRTGRPWWWWWCGAVARERRRDGDGEAGVQQRPLHHATNREKRRCCSSPWTHMCALEFVDRSALLPRAH